MSTLDGPLELYTPGTGSQQFYSSTDDTSPGYTHAKALPTSGEGSLWVVYTVTKWDKGHPSSREPPVSFVIEPNKGSVDVSPNRILSIQGFNANNPGIILFEHSQYRGEGRLYTSSNPNITDSFPANTVEGVSSVIVLGGEWQLFDGYNGQGTALEFEGSTVFEPQCRYYSFGGTAINDKAASIGLMNKN